MQAFGTALDLVFTWQVMITILLSSVFGLLVGAIPGLTATMATALLVPFAFMLDPVSAIAAIVSATAMAIFAGDIPGSLLRDLGRSADEELFQASMGIYVFNRKVLVEALNNDYVDFGKGGSFSSVSRRWTLEDQAKVEGLASRFYDRFLSLVAEHRHMDVEAVHEIAQGPSGRAPKRRRWAWWTNP